MVNPTVWELETFYRDRDIMIIGGGYRSFEPKKPAIKQVFNILYSQKNYSPV